MDTVPCQIVSCAEMERGEKARMERARTATIVVFTIYANFVGQVHCALYFYG
jgi:hypothetical protein